MNSKFVKVHIDCRLYPVSYTCAQVVAYPKHISSILLADGGITFAGAGNPPSNSPAPESTATLLISVRRYHTDPHNTEGDDHTVNLNPYQSLGNFAPGNDKRAKLHSLLMNGGENDTKCRFELYWRADRCGLQQSCTTVARLYNVTGKVNFSKRVGRGGIVYRIKLDLLSYHVPVFEKRPVIF